MPILERKASDLLTRRLQNMGATSPQFQPGNPADERSLVAPGSARGDIREPLAIVDQLPGAVLLLDASGRIVHLNGIAELRLDLVRGEALGRDLFREVLPNLESSGFGVQFRQAMAEGGAALATEVTFDRASGPRRVSLGIRSFVQQGTLCAVVLLEDRTALAAEEQRRRRAEELAAVGELATGVAHEINNPLASIKGFAQLLSNDAASETQVQGLEIISQECSRVARIIDRLLDFADQQRAREPVGLSLSALADGVLDLRQYALETAGIEVQRDLDGGLSPVRGDPGALQRVVLALLRQAERSLHTPDPGRRLTVRTRESTDGVVLYVIDNGRGLPRSRLRTLFSGLDPEDGGEGIGLASAMTIVREHGGHLWADSIESRGTAFFLRLPRLEETAAAAVAVAEPEPQAVRSVPSRPLRVLVADDEATLRLAIALFLGRHGHEVVQAADAYEAHRLALAEPFDAVIADARMPGDGIALLEKLDELPRLKGRTILMTGDHFQGMDDDGVETRPRLAKPFDLTEVIRLVEALGR